MKRVEIPPAPAAPGVARGRVRRPRFESTPATFMRALGFPEGVTSPVLCSNCHRPLPTNATICPACGAVTDSGEEHTGGSGAVHTGGSGG